MLKKMICAQPCPAITINNEVVAEQMSVPVTSNAPSAPCGKLSRDIKDWLCHVI